MYKDKDLKGVIECVEAFIKNHKDIPLHLIDISNLITILDEVKPKKKDKIKIYGNSLRKLSSKEAHALMLSLYDVLNEYAKHNNKSALVCVDYGKGVIAI